MKRAAKPLGELADGNRGTRSIDDASAAGLGYSMAEFADLSGIVINVRGGAWEIVAGHQRLAQLRAAGATTATVEREHDGTHEGAGYVEHPATHDRFPVRLVDWDADKATAARYAANSDKIAGGFTALALPELEALGALPELAPLRFAELRATLADSFPPAAGDDFEEPKVAAKDRAGRREFLFRVAPSDARVVDEAVGLLRAHLCTESDDAAFVEAMRVVLGADRPEKR